MPMLLHRPIALCSRIVRPHTAYSVSYRAQSTAVKRLADLLKYTKSEDGLDSKHMDEAINTIWKNDEENTTHEVSYNNPLFRLLVEYNHWKVPATPEKPFLFAATEEKFEQPYTQKFPSVELKEDFGFVLFSPTYLDSAQYDGVNLNGLTKAIPSDLFPVLQRYAYWCTLHRAAVHIEKAWESGDHEELDTWAESVIFPKSAKQATFFTIATPPEGALNVRSFLVQNDTHVMAFSSRWLCEEFFETLPTHLKKEFQVSELAIANLYDYMHQSPHYKSVFWDAEGGETFSFRAEWTRPLVEELFKNYSISMTK